MGMNKRLQPKRPMRAASQSNSNQSFFVKMIDGIGLGELSELFLLGVIGGCKPQATSQQKRRANSLLLKEQTHLSINLFTHSSILSLRFSLLFPIVLAPLLSSLVGGGCAWGPHQKKSKESVCSAAPTNK